MNVCFWKFSLNIFRLQMIVSKLTMESETADKGDYCTSKRLALSFLYIRVEPAFVKPSAMQFWMMLFFFKENKITKLRMQY